MAKRATTATTADVVSSGSSTVLIAGALGYIGRYVAEASLASGVKTYVLCRPGSATPTKAAAIEGLKWQGAVFIEGNVNDKELMEKILRKFKIDVVIALMGGRNIADQFPLVEAIKTVGTVKRFLPSEFGNDPDRANPVEPGLRLYNLKKNIRRTIEAAEIPYTYICCNSIAGWPYYDKHHVTEIPPPMDQFPIYGDDNFKVYYVAGSDIGKFTIKAALDARTLNKTVHFRPSCNFLNMNELASLWEKKIGRTLPRVTVTEEELLAIASENRIPDSIVAAFTHEVYIKGCQTNFSIDGPKDIEISCLYPDIPFKTVDACFDQFVPAVLGKQGGENVPTESMMGRMPVAAT